MYVCIDFSNMVNHIKELVGVEREIETIIELNYHEWASVIFFNFLTTTNLAINMYLYIGHLKLILILTVYTCQVFK